MHVGTKHKAHSLPRHIDFRELCGVPELKKAERLQMAVWGEDDKPDNSDILLAIQHEGGLIAGAFEGDRMLGFLFGFPCRESGVQHSHRLAVHPDSQGLGLGEKMKWYQRRWCLENGIHTVRWTYDPARRVNAGLNIGKLGATAKTYYDDYYGPMEGINAGVPSDRLLAEWHLNDPLVRLKAGEIEKVDMLIETPIRVSIPKDFQDLLDQDRKTALAERLRIRSELSTAFADGYQIIDFDLTGHCYLLGRDDRA